MRYLPIYLLLILLTVSMVSAEEGYSFDSPQGVKYQYGNDYYPSVDIPDTVLSLADQYVSMVDIKHVSVRLSGGNAIVKLELYGDFPDFDVMVQLLQNSMYVFYGGQIHFNNSGTNFKVRFDISIHPENPNNKPIHVFFAFYDPNDPQFEINVTDGTLYRINGNTIEIIYQLDGYENVQFYPPSSNVTKVAVSATLGYYHSLTVQNLKLKQDILVNTALSLPQPPSPPVGGGEEEGGEGGEGGEHGETPSQPPATGEAPAVGGGEEGGEGGPQEGGEGGGLNTWILAIGVVAVIAIALVSYLKFMKS